MTTKSRHQEDDKTDDDLHPSSGEISVRPAGQIIIFPSQMRSLGLFLISVFGYLTVQGVDQNAIPDEHLQKIQDHLERMNEIQQQLLEMDKKKPKVAIGNRPSNKEKNGTVKPDELPYLWEGDIVLNKDQMDEMYRSAKDMLWAQKNQKRRSSRSMTSDLSLRWTFPIPYYISLTTGVNEAAVLAGVQKWQTETCATFTRVYNLPSSNALNFILGDGCYSYIGRQGAVQVVSIGYGCDSLGTVTHEIGHALGFYHEQARYDRDSYVNILTQNIENIYLSQFTKQSFSSMVDYGVGYDLGSVMHYPATAFTSDGSNTIQTLDQNYQLTIGQRVAPSFADVKRINLAYCNYSCSIDLNCLNGGYTDPKNCNQCRCPSGFGGILCEKAASNPSGCGIGDLSAAGYMQTIQASGTLACSYVIIAPPGKRVFFQLASFSFPYSNPCVSSYLEIKYGTEFVSTGARFCYYYPSNSLTQTNQLVVLYRGSSNSAFSINFRYDPVDVVPTPAPTTTTTQRTTGWTTYPWWIASTTTAATTTQPAVWTFFPQTSTASSGCSPWTGCTALCGGCGTQTRLCDSQLQTIVCNTVPCEGKLCCLPYLFDGQGQCRRPFSGNSEDEAVQTIEGSGEHLFV